jgi:ribosomal protein L1
MATHDAGRRYDESREKVDVKRLPSRLAEAIALVRETATARLRRERLTAPSSSASQPGKGDQNVRGTVVLPHGTGKVPRVAVFAEGEAVRAAQRPQGPTASAVRTWSRPSATAGTSSTSSSRSRR